MSSRRQSHPADNHAVEGVILVQEHLPVENQIAAAVVDVIRRFQGAGGINRDGIGAE
jgi:hypothetical protein